MLCLNTRDVCSFIIIYYLFLSKFLKNINFKRLTLMLCNIITVAALKPSYKYFTINLRVVLYNVCVYSRRMSAWQV